MIFYKNSGQKIEERAIYYLSYQDVQTVADDYLDRSLSDDKIELLEDAIAERIDWFGAIVGAISTKIETSVE